MPTRDGLMTWREIAEETGMSVSEVKDLYKSAMRKLRNMEDVWKDLSDKSFTPGLRRLGKKPAK